MATPPSMCSNLHAANSIVVAPPIGGWVVATIVVDTCTLPVELSHNFG